jgi:hypothetical protein
VNGGRHSCAADEETGTCTARRPLDAPVPNLRDDPEYAAAAELLGVFADRLRAIGSEGERINLERHFALKSPDDDTNTILRTKPERCTIALRRPLRWMMPPAPARAGLSPRSKARNVWTRSTGRPERLRRCGV